MAGGHGALAALFLVLTSAQRAVVVDPADVGGGGVQECWGEYYEGKELEYRYECLRSGLKAELEGILKPSGKGSGRGVDPTRVLVVACHACQHLTDETLEIACSFGVHVTVMPCCQKDPTNGSSYKAFAKQIGIGIGPLMDILAAGKVMSWNNGKDTDSKYRVRMKAIDEAITPQNRMILCKASSRGEVDVIRGGSSEAQRLEVAHGKLETAYRKAHGGNDAHSQRRHYKLDADSDSCQSIKMKRRNQIHKEQSVRLRLMKFAKRTLHKSSQEGISLVNVTINKDENINGKTSSIADTLLWKNLRLLSLLKFSKKTTDDGSVVMDINADEIGDVGNPVHGLAAVKHIQDILSTETIAAAGICIVGSILSLMLSSSGSSNK